MRSTEESDGSLTVDFRPTSRLTKAWRQKDRILLELQLPPGKDAKSRAAGVQRLFEAGLQQPGRSTPILDVYPGEMYPSTLIVTYQRHTDRNLAVDALSLTRLLAEFGGPTSKELADGIHTLFDPWIRTQEQYSSAATTRLPRDGHAR